MREKTKKLITKPIVYGVFGTILLISVYFAILSVANSFEHTLFQFYSMWYFIVILSLGFGIQVGLWTHVKNYTNTNPDANITATMGASGGVSSVSMAACCAHHVTDFLPILGLSAAALFLTKYQTFFILFGIVSNVVGVLIMLSTIQTHKLYDTQSKFRKIMQINMRGLLKITVVVGAIVLLWNYMIII